MGAYVKGRLFKDAPRRSVRSWQREHTAALSQVLGRLAKLQWTSSLSDLAVAAKIGALPMTPELEQEILAMGKEVRNIRQLLMRALGFSAGERP